MKALIFLAGALAVTAIVWTIIKAWKKGFREGGESYVRRQRLRKKNKIVG